MNSNGASTQQRFLLLGWIKARIVVLDDGKTVAHRYASSITDADQRRMFARTFNELRALVAKATGSAQ